MLIKVYLHRAKFGEQAFLDIYQKLYEAPDPAPMLSLGLVKCCATTDSAIIIMSIDAAGLCLHLHMGHWHLKDIRPVTKHIGLASVHSLPSLLCLPQEVGARAAEMEAAATKMAGELAEYKAESKELRNQEHTIRRLEDKARSLEAQLEDKVPFSHKWCTGQLKAPVKFLCFSDTVVLQQDF